MSNIVPFGKYKGQPVEVMADDREYCEWLLAQPWAKQKLGAVYNIVINSGAEPQDTPEHNALQAKFLDDAVCLQLWALLAPADHVASLAEPAGVEAAVARAVVGTLRDRLEHWAEQLGNAESALERNRERLAGRDPDEVGSPSHHQIALYQRYVREGEERAAKARAALALLGDPSLTPADPPSIEHHPPVVGRRAFEAEGWDVTFDIGWSARASRSLAPCIASRWQIEDGPVEVLSETRRGGRGFAVECKPTMGDDFPSVLRQVQRHGKNLGTPCVVLGSYTGVGATLDQVRAMFAASGIRLVMLGEILP